jgi:hypothetical protein
MPTPGFDLDQQYAQAAGAAEAQVQDPNAPAAAEQSVQTLEIPADQYASLQQLAAAGDFENLGKTVAQFLQ